MARLRSGRRWPGGGFSGRPDEHHFDGVRPGAIRNHQLRAAELTAGTDCRRIGCACADRDTAMRCGDERTHGRNHEHNDRKDGDPGGFAVHDITVLASRPGQRETASGNAVRSCLRELMPIFMMAFSGASRPCGCSGTASRSKGRQPANWATVH